MTSMTSHYVDITVVPDAETGVPALMGALYGKLHRALVQLRLDSLGISFPQYSVTPRNIGHTLRLHASEATLQSFLSHDWLPRNGEIKIKIGTRKQVGELCLIL